MISENNLDSGNADRAMTTATLESRRVDVPAPLAGRRGLSSFMGEVCRRTGADAFVVLDAVPGDAGGETRVLASNWVYDAIQWVGVETLRHIAESPVAAFVGAPPRGWHPLALAILLGREEIAGLIEFGHEEIVALKLRAGAQRYFVLLSSATSGALDDEALAAEHMTCCYAIARFGDASGPTPANPLSERERECLSWVSHGKTTEEVGLILDVSSNTINSYIAHAIHKLSASNRAMAIATALRRNLI